MAARASARVYAYNKGSFEMNDNKQTSSGGQCAHITKIFISFSLFFIILDMLMWCGWMSSSSSSWLQKKGKRDHEISRVLKCVTTNITVFDICSYVRAYASNVAVVFTFCREAGFSTPIHYIVVVAFLLCFSPSTLLYHMHTHTTKKYTLYNLYSI